MAARKADSSETSSTRHGVGTWLGRLARALFLLIVAATGFGGGLAYALVSAYAEGLPDVTALETYQPAATTRVFASNGELIATLYRENRTWLPLAHVPDCMRKAIVASEDARFYQHAGIDPVGMARVLWVGLRSRGLSQGASTITMQLARGVFLNDERTVRRKVQEMMVAWQLEHRFSKDKLLELYLNQIYFGAGAYGLEAAAQTYFAKKAAKLDLAESALIVGVVPAPSEYSPFASKKLALERQHLVLRRMTEVGAITEAQARAARDEKLRFARPRKDPYVLKYPYYTTWLLHELISSYGEDALYRGGLKIYASLDPAMQRAAEDAVARGLRDAASQHVTQAALVAIEPSTGFVRAMVGGTGWSTSSQFNRAWQAQRPAGSGFKLFVYGAALEAGLSPDSVVPDAPVTLHIGPSDDWTPKNSDGRFMGAIPLRTALRFSRNTVSARLIDALSPARVVDLAYKMGVRSHIEAVCSIALGACAVTPFDMASALAVIAQGGRRHAPTGVRFILDAEGNVAIDNRKQPGEVAMNPIAALGLTEMMQGVVEGGTGYTARLSDRPAAGKTGTTDAHRDAWFVGFVPQLAAAVWVGNDDDSQMYGTFGGDVPAPIWRSFMQAAMAGRPVMHFGADADGNVTVKLCRANGLRATTLCPEPETRTFRWDAVPQRYCGTHVFVKRGGEAITTKRDEPSNAPQPQPSATAVDEEAAPAPTPSTEEEPTPVSGGPEPSQTTAPAPSPSLEPPAPPPPTSSDTEPAPPAHSEERTTRAAPPTRPQTAPRDAAPKAPPMPPPPTAD